MILFADRLAAYQARVEQALPEFFPTASSGSGGQVVEAARYSLLGGGKRIRPVLLLATSELLGVAEIDSMPFACALEMIHTYSLIHDDLPCMDDDDLRRGRPTCHIKYGEAMAVLAGDALLNRAFEIMLAAVRPEQPGTILAARQIARASGSIGMIGGQALDLAAAGQKITLEQLKELHRMKTGALLKAPILAATALAGKTGKEAEALERYSEAIGLAFQIKDDILDATADSGTLGKSAGKDVRDDKPTYASLLGLSEAHNQLASTIDSAKEALQLLSLAGFNPVFLDGLADYLFVRTR